MSVEFTWSVKPQGLRVKDANGNPDTVVSVEFKISAIDGAHTVDMSNVVEFKPEANAPFIPFDQLTEAQVIDWVKAALPQSTVERFEQMLTQRLERQKNPPAVAVAKVSPWATCVQN